MPNQRKATSNRTKNSNTNSPISSVFIVFTVSIVEAQGAPAKLNYVVGGGGSKVLISVTWCVGLFISEQIGN
jgi:hypothetical protein